MNKFYELLFKQLNSFYFLNNSEKDLILSFKDKIDNRLIYNASQLKNKYYSDIEKLSPYHTCQYAMFLYFASNTIFYETGENREICDKIYNLLKLTSSMDLYYEVKLPEIFMFDHPMGTVLGRAKYGNYFSFSQGCTVGNNKGIFPEFGDFVSLKSNAKVIGNSKIGNNVIVSANTYIKDTDIPDNSIVFGSDRNLIIKTYTKEEMRKRFEIYYKGVNITSLE